MEKEGNFIKLLLRGNDCCLSFGCYNIKGEIEYLEKGKYILEFQEIDSDVIVKKEIYIN